MTDNILTLDADIVAVIFSIVMFDSFYDFANLFWVWHRSQSLAHIRSVLHKLDWEKIYDFDQEPNESVRQRFQNFIGTCVEIDIVQAKFYISCKRLFRLERVEESLSVLHEQGSGDFPSYFAYLVFQAIFRPFQTPVTAQQMSEVVKDPKLRMKLPFLITLLQLFYDVDEDKLMPRVKICPNARNREPFSCTNWPATCKDVWYSLCNQTVNDDYMEDGGVLGKPLTMNHILQTRCCYCPLQIILFKILHGGYLYY